MDGNSKNRSIYFVSEAVKTILNAKDSDRLRLVNTGVKIFVRQGSPMEGGSPLRISADGLALLTPYVSDKRCVDLSTNELRAIVTKAFPKIEEFDAEHIERLTALGMRLSTSNTHLPFIVLIWSICLLNRTRMLYFPLRYKQAKR